MIDLYEYVDEFEKRAKALGWSIETLCKKSGVGVATFYRWRAKEADPTTSLLNKIEAVLVAAERRL